MEPLLDPSIAKAERLLQLRKLAKLSRKDIAEIASVSVFTYKGWENARFGGIPPKRAALLAELLQTEGIKCSADWIMHGTGEPPKKLLFYQINQLKEAASDPTKQPPEVIEELSIKAELEFFCNNNNWDTLSYTVLDDSMEPYFLQHDLVAGAKVSVEDFNKTIGLNCIVRTKNNKILLRQIQKSNIDGLFTLLCLNSNSKQQVILQDEELIDIAPAIWIRRKTALFLKNHCKENTEP